MTPCPLPRVGRRRGVFASDVRDARVGRLAQLRVHATRGSAPSAALGRFEDGAPASRDRLRCSFVAQGPITPEITASYQPLRELMTFVMGRS